jgi:hypothetical protein
MSNYIVLAHIIVDLVRVAIMKPASPAKQFEHWQGGQADERILQVHRKGDVALHKAPRVGLVVVAGCPEMVVAMARSPLSWIIRGCCWTTATTRSYQQASWRHWLGIFPKLP